MSGMHMVGERRGGKEKRRKGEKEKGGVCKIN
jgi:hypothetical protein